MRKVMMTMMVLLLAVTIATAQRGQGQRPPALPAELNLTTEQQEQIKAIRQATRTEMQELRTQNPDQRPDRAAMKKMREASMAKVEAILTTEQREQLAALKAERKAAWKAVDKKGMKEALKAHHETKVKPVLSAARSQLDQFISAEDKTALERLRPVFAAKPKGKAGKGRSKGKARGEKPSEADIAARKAAMETWKEDHAEEIAELKTLTKKYATDLKRIKERMQPQQEQWGKEKREIMQEYLPEEAGKMKRRGGKNRKDKSAKGKRKGMEQKKGKPGKAGHEDWPKGAAFLLMQG
jgi:Spy/CpxP family protein refolding chaperone